MERNESRSYSFKFLGVRFDIDIDESFSGIECRRFAAEKADVNEIHYHAKHELFFVPDGPLTVYTNSRPVEYRGSVVFVPAFCKHYSVRSNDYRLLLSFESLGGRKTEFAIFIEKYFSASAPFSFLNCNETCLYLDELKRVLSNRDGEEGELIASVFKLMLHRVYSTSKKTENTEKRCTDESYVIIIERLINKYKSDVTLTSVAKELHLSTKQTSRIIMRTFKKPLSALVTEKRLAVAEGLLINTDLSISEIVERVNFRSENYFYLRFKCAFGITPRGYRKKYQSKQNLT